MGALLRLAAVAVCVASAAAAQPFLFGVKGGAALTDAIDGSYGVSSAAKRYVVGPTAELRLPHAFAVEVSALYRRTGFNSTSGFLGLTTDVTVRANSWEFPVLAKYYFGRGVRPFVAAGIAVRQLSGVKYVIHNYGIAPVTGEAVDTTYRPPTTYLLRDNPTAGPVVAAGLSLRAGPLRLAPELRYTRWTGRPFNEEGSRGYFVHSTQNQLDLLISLTF